MGGLQHFSVSPRPLGLGVLGLGAKGLGPGLDNASKYADFESQSFYFIY